MTERTVNSEQNQETIADYLGDMQALESHIEEALDHQLDMFDDLPQAKSAVQGFHDMVKEQRDAVTNLIEQLPKDPATNVVKDVGSSLLGKAAGLIDKIRTESNSKALRDDYTAFNLAAISYNMLFTTATALGNSQVASLSEKHLRGYARAVQQINDLIPQVVVSELKKDGHQVDSGAAQTAQSTVDRAWKQTSN